MEIKLFTFTVMFICNYSVFADIAPNPIRARGIVTNWTTDIRMVSEKVTVDLFQDHSEVECLFVMKNEGKKQEINIGFPEMSFHHFTRTRSIESGSSFLVLENEKKVQLIDLYTPTSTLPKDSPEFDKQPWYLWFSEFNEGETKVIKVRYTLPFGAIYKNSGNRYFTYLLNTGSGWKGSIDTAEVIVNLKDFPTDSISQLTPANYKIEKNQITWKFFNLEPTLNDDIKIFYKSLKVVEEKRPEPTFVLNEKIVSGFDFNPMMNDILTVKVLKSLKDTKNYISGSEGVVLIYTYDYAINNLEKLIASTIRKKLKYASSSDFMNKYRLVIDTAAYENKEFLLKVLELKEDEIKDIKIKKEPAGKTCIQIQKL